MAIAVPYIAKGLGAFLVSKVVSTLSKPKSRTPLDTSKPAQLSERGSYIPIMVGSHVMAPVFCWEGNRRTENEDAAGGSGGKGAGSGGGGSNVVHFADGMLAFCVGPAKRLRKIRFNGRQVWPFEGSGGTTGLVDQDLGIESHTSISGTSYILANNEQGGPQGSFTVYWGEPDQPTDPTLTDSTGLGTLANHGHIFYLLFKDTRLGGAGTWPSITVEADVGPYNPGQIFNGGFPPRYEDLIPVLSNTSPAWKDDGLAPDIGDPDIINDGQCYEILNYDAASGTVTACSLSPHVPQDLLGFTVEIFSNAESANGRYRASGVTSTATPGVFPTGTPKPRLVTGALDPQQFGNSLYTDLGGTIGDPPGVLSQSFGSGTAVRLDLVKQDGVNEAVIGGTVTTPTLPSGGGSLTAGVNIATYYIRPPAAGGDTSATVFSLRFNYLSTTPIPVAFGAAGLAQFEARDGAVTPVFQGDGILDTFINDIGDGWFEVSAMFYAPQSTATSVSPDDAFSMQFALETNDATHLGQSLEIAYGQGSGATEQLQLLDAGTCPFTITFTLQPGPALLTPYTGQICVLARNGRGASGANAAHLLGQLLFETAPHGAGVDRDCYNEQDIVDMGVALNDEFIRSHTVIQGGDSIQSGIEALASEVGFIRYWDAINGRYGIRLVREEGPIATIDEDLLAPDLPGLSRKQGREVRTDLRYIFLDSERNYRENDVLIPLDNEAATAVDKHSLLTVRDQESAEIVADRLSQVEHGRPAVLNLIGMRDCQLVRNGDVLSVGNLFGPEILYRVIEVTLNPTLIETKLSLVSEQYSAPSLAPEAISGPGGLGTNLGSVDSQQAVAAEDVKSRVWEASGFLGRQLQFVPLRIAGNKDSQTALVLTSGDDVSYTTETSTGSTPSGLLVSDWLADYEEIDNGGPNTFASFYRVEFGPVFSDTSGSMVNRTRTLSDREWLAGRQWLLVDDEVMHVREFETLGGNLWRARGVVRARYETLRQDHLVGSCAFVLSSEQLELFKVPSAGRGLDLYTKLVPRAGASQVPPANITPNVLQPVGKGIRPLPLRSLTTSDYVNCWRQGKDITYTWQYSLHDALVERTGAGMQGAGEVTGTSTEEWDGTFLFSLVEVATNNVIVAPTSLTDNQITVPAASMVGFSGDVAVVVIPFDASSEAGDRITLVLPED